MLKKGHKPLQKICPPPQNDQEEGVVDINSLADILIQKLDLNLKTKDKADVKQVNVAQAPQIQCQLCQNMGHDAPNCVKFSNTPMPMRTSCQLCGTQGHIAPQCPSLWPTQPQRRPRRKDRRQIQCFNCGNWGHYQSECQGSSSSRPVHQGNDNGPTQQQ